MYMRKWPNICHRLLCSPTRPEPQFHGPKVLYEPPPCIQVVGILSPTHCSVYNWFVFAAYDSTIYSLFIRNKFDSKQKRNAVRDRVLGACAASLFWLFFFFFILIILCLALAITSNTLLISWNVQPKVTIERKTDNRWTCKSRYLLLAGIALSMSDRIKLLLIIMLNADRFSYALHSFSSMVLCSSSTDLNLNTNTQSLCVSIGVNVSRSVRFIF